MFVFYFIWPACVTNQLKTSSSRRECHERLVEVDSSAVEYFFGTLYKAIQHLFVISWFACCDVTSLVYILSGQFLWWIQYLLTQSYFLRVTARKMTFASYVISFPRPTYFRILWPVRMYEDHVLCWRSNPADFLSPATGKQKILRKLLSRAISGGFSACKRGCQNRIRSN